MLQNRSVLTVTDNTGVLRVRAFWLRGGHRPRSHGGVGDVRVASVVATRADCKRKKGDVVHVLIVRTKTALATSTGRQCFHDNACILVTAAPKGHRGSPWVPVGSRLQGPLPRLLRDKGFAQVLARAEATV